MSDDELRRSAVLRAAEGFKRAESSQFVADLKRTVRSPAVASLSEMQVAAERWRQQLPGQTKEMIERARKTTATSGASISEEKPTLTRRPGAKKGSGRHQKSGSLYVQQIRELILNGETRHGAVVIVAARINQKDAQPESVHKRLTRHYVRVYGKE